MQHTGNRRRREAAPRVCSHLLTNGEETAAEEPPPALTLTAWQEPQRGAHTHPVLRRKGPAVGPSGRLGDGGDHDEDHGPTQANVHRRLRSGQRGAGRERFQPRGRGRGEDRYANGAAVMQIWRPLCKSGGRYANGASVMQMRGTVFPAKWAKASKSARRTPTVPVLASRCFPARKASGGQTRSQLGAFPPGDAC